MMDRPPQCPDSQIWGEQFGKMNGSVARSETRVWLDLQRTWRQISVDVLIVELCCCNKRERKQISQFSVAKNIHFS